MQKWRDPSFLHTNTTMLHHRDWLGWIAPTFSMSLRDVLTSSNKEEGIHLNCFLKGSLSVMQISCSITLVQPSLLSSKLKMSWKVRTSSLTTVAFPGVQELKPSRLDIQLALLGTILQGEQVMWTPHVLFSCPSSNRWGCLTCCIPQWIPCHFPS